MATTTKANQTKTTEIKIDDVELDVEHSAIPKNENIWDAEVDLYSVRINNQAIPLDWFKRDFVNDMICQIRLHENKDRQFNDEYKSEMIGDQSRGN